MSITRSEVIQRAATVWPLGHVPYSQMTAAIPAGGRTAPATHRCAWTCPSPD